MLSERSVLAVFMDIRLYLLTHLDVKAKRAMAKRNLEPMLNGRHFQDRVQPRSGMNHGGIRSFPSNVAAAASATVTTPPSTVIAAPVSSAATSTLSAKSPTYSTLQNVTRPFEQVNSALIIFCHRSRRA
jgi:hypothetical protein